MSWGVQAAVTSAAAILLLQCCSGSGSGSSGRLGIFLVLAAAVIVIHLSEYTCASIHIYALTSVETNMGVDVRKVGHTVPI